MGFISKKYWFYWSKPWFRDWVFGIISPMKKTNNTLQKDAKTMEEMVASLRLQLVESEQKHQEHIKSKDTLISALHHQLFLLKNAKFGRRTEKLEEDKQLDLGFDEAELLSAQEIEPEEIIETKTPTC